KLNLKFIAIKIFLLTNNKIDKLESFFLVFYSNYRIIFYKQNHVFVATNSSIRKRIRDSLICKLDTESRVFIQLYRFFQSTFFEKK
ncbi:hypothetical protein CI593_16885, partial [Fischerella thermalis CCMEE 5194]